MMDICTPVNSFQVGANPERPGHDKTQPRPEKLNNERLAGVAVYESMRRYLERVDRYLARPDVTNAGHNAAPSSAP